MQPNTTEVQASCSFLWHRTQNDAPSPINRHPPHTSRNPNSVRSHAATPRDACERIDEPLSATHAPGSIVCPATAEAASAALHWWFREPLAAERTLALIKPGTADTAYGPIMDAIALATANRSSVSA